MLRINIDLVPYGDTTNISTIETMYLWNTTERGNDLDEFYYKAVLVNEDGEVDATASTCHTRSDGAWILVAKLVDNTHDEIDEETLATFERWIERNGKL